MTRVPHVVILGAGFAGVAAMKALRRAPAKVTLIDRNDYHTFQPLLYQAATAVLSASEIGFPLRQMLHGRRDWAFHQASVSGIDLARKQVSVEDLAPIAYDYLVIGLGATVNFFGTKGAEDHAFPLYTMRDALRLKAHILALFEAADKNPALIDDGAFTFCVVGGGATGVEISGALADLLTMELKEDYPNLPVERAQVHLYEAGPRLLGFFKPRLQEYAMRSLEKRGVRVHLGEGVVEVEPTRVHLKSGAVVPAHTLVWGTGLQPSPVVASLGIELTKGRAPVVPDLSLRDHPEVFVAGDIAIVVNPRTMQPLPQLGSVAKQAGRHAGLNIARLLNGRRAEPFVYRDRGIMGAIGRGAAVAELPMGLTLTGYPAWWMWLAVHLLLLAGGEAKFLTVLDWVWGLRIRNRSKRIVVN